MSERVNHFELNPRLRIVCANAVRRLENERRRNLEPKQQRRRSLRGDTNGVTEAFRLAEKEHDELARLKAQYPQYSGLHFVGRWGYERAKLVLSSRRGCLPPGYTVFLEREL
jgi:hypothetical protein